MLTQNIESHAQEDYQSRYSEALGLAPHPEDAPYLALALKLEIPVWSNDSGMKRQKSVKVFATHDLLKKLSA